MDVILLHSNHPQCFDHSCDHLHGGENKNTNTITVFRNHSIVKKHIFGFQCISFVFLYIHVDVPCWALISFIFPMFRAFIRCIKWMVFFKKKYYSHGMTWYDIYLLTAIGLIAGGSSTVHIYIQTIHRTTQWNRIHRTEHV